ncbi:MAG: hypothetical protein IJ042_03590 [Butyricicoccus sp.]|nr:hypothetical protein [Butyricicoccus sp.]
MGKTCFFIGHRYEDVDCDRLAEEIERHIVEYGVDTFVIGHYGFFDLMATHYVAEAKKKHSHVKLYRLLPYLPKEGGSEPPESYDGTIYMDGIEKVPYRFAIVQSNRRMVDRSDYLITNAWQPGSNSLKVVEYARKKGNIGITRLND